MEFVCLFVCFFCSNEITVMLTGKERTGKPALRRNVFSSIAVAGLHVPLPTNWELKAHAVDYTLHFGLLKRASFQTMMTGRLRILKDLIFSESRP
jgi:hypothetical protein